MNNPSHAILNSDGTYSVVYPGGYDEEDLIPLPEDYYSRGWYKLNGTEFGDDLDSWINYVINKANEIRDEKMYSSYETSIGEIQTDTASRNLLISIAIAALSSEETYTVDITLKDNSTVTCDKEAVIQLMNDVRSKDQVYHAECTAVKETARNSQEIIEGLL